MADPDLYRAIDLELSDLVKWAALGEGQAFTTGPGAERHADRIRELAGQVKILCDDLRQTMSEIRRLSDEG